MTKQTKLDINPKRILLAVAFLVMAAVDLCAQNNSFKIRDDLYAIYTKAYTHRRTAKGLHLADSMLVMADKAHDRKAQCLALTIPVYYHFARSNEEAFDKAGKALQDRAMKTGCVEFYYFVMSNKVDWMLLNGKESQVLSYVRQIQKFAAEHHHTYGIYTGYRSLAAVQLQRGDAMQAIDGYKKALEFGEQYLPGQDMALNYLGMVECYRYLEDYQQVLNCVDKGLAVSKTQQSRILLLQSKCYALFMFKKDVEFMQLFPQAERYTGTLGGTGINMVAELCIFKKIIEGNYESALHDIDNVKSLANRLHLYVAFYSRLNNYQLALSYYKQIISLRDNMAATMGREDLAAMNARYNNQQLEMEKQQMAFQKTRLQLANTQLTLENSSLELNRAKASEHLAKLNSDNFRLSLNNKQLEAKRLRASLNAAKALREARVKEVELNNTILLILLIVTVVVLALTAIYTYNSRKMSRRLKDLNEDLRETVSELSVAKEKAQQSDRMKTMFIQNMSHEIRTPLNAIVGYSQVLIEMGDQLEEADKMEMGKNVADSAELLSTLINDILDMTSLESGRYVMKTERVEVEDLCRHALKTVAHRCAPGVELKCCSGLPEGYTVDTDGTRVKQVLINLLTNAEKNTTQGSITLATSLSEYPGYLTFSVTDTGIGIPQDKVNEIFERFKKLDKFKQGTGLGLNICKMIAEKLGGQIFVDERYTHGARFVFTVKL